MSASTHEHAWADRLLAEEWDGLVGLGLPMPVRSTKTKTYKSYGCGSYGCVYETQSEAVVLKLTTDPTEAAFVERAIEIGHWPRGIVEYFYIERMSGTRHGDVVYVLWREAAQQVGMLGADENELYGLPFVDKMALKAIENAGGVAMKIAASEMVAMAHGGGEEQAKAFVQTTTEAARVLSKTPITIYSASSQKKPGLRVNLNGQDVWIPHWPSPPGKGRKDHLPWRMALAWLVAERYAESLAQEGPLQEVGEAILFYQKHGMLLADVRIENIGLVRRKGEWVWAITDPGHAVSSDEKMLSVAPNPTPGFAVLLEGMPTHGAGTCER